MNLTPTQESEKPTVQCMQVYFDGSCPLCSKEISIYQNSNTKTPIEWIDVSSSDCTIDNKEQYLQRFHIRDAQGTTHSGAKAFVTLWSAFAGWRILSLVFNNKLLLPIAEYAYVQFLKVRPKMQQWARRKST